MISVQKSAGEMHHFVVMHLSSKILSIASFSAFVTVTFLLSVNFLLLAEVGCQLLSVSISALQVAQQVAQHLSR